jgi:transportin-3
MDENRLGLLLKSLYSSSDNETVKEASKQLNEWQQTAVAWKQADGLLGTAGLQAEFYYFFAQTLKTKIQYDMYQLPQVQLSALRDSLIQKLLAIVHSSAAKATRKQLCLALADLTIQTSDTWTNAIPDLVNLLAQNHPLELIDILRLIPEETENLKLMTESDKRNQARYKCVEYYYSVLEFLNGKFISLVNDAEARSLVLECFLAWLRFDSPPIQYSLADSPMVNYALTQIASISRDDLAIDDKCVEIIAEVLRSTNDYRNNSSSNSGHPLIEQKVFPQVYLVVQVLLTIDIQRRMDDDTVDIDSVKSIARLISLTAEGMMSAIVSSPHDSRINDLLLVIIKLFQVHSIEVSEILVPFIEDYLSATAPAVGVAKTSSPVHDKLFETIVCRCDVKTESSFNQTDPFTSIDTDYYYFRNSELLKLLYTIARDFLGRTHALEKLIKGLVLHCDSTSAVSNSFTIQEAFAICVKDQLSAISDPPDSTRAIVDLLSDRLGTWINVDSIHSCSVVDTFRRRAFINLIGSLACWIHKPDQLFKLIDLVAQILIRPSVGHRSIHTAAAVSLRDLCLHSHCRNMITGGTGPSGAIESITKLFGQTIGHLPASEHSILTEGIVTIVSAQGDDQVFVNLVRGVILGPLVDMLNQHRQAADIVNSGICVDRMTAVIRSLNRLQRGTVRYNAIGEIVTNSIWPSLGSCMETFKSEPDLVEKSCRLVKHSLRAVPDFFKQVLIPLGQLLIRDFAQCQHSSYLYTAEVLGQEYAKEADVRPALSELFDNLVSSGVGLLESKLHATPVFSGSPDNLDELSEDLFGMIERYLRFCPAIVIRSQSLLSVFRVLVPTIKSMKRRETIEAVSAFVEQIYSGQWTHNKGSLESVSDTEVVSVRKNLLELAPLVIVQLFDLVVQVCGRAMRVAIPSILMVMNSFDPHAFGADWIVRGLSRVPTSVMTDKDKHEAIKALCSIDDERAITRCVEDILYRAELVNRRVRNEQ